MWVLKRSAVTHSTKLSLVLANLKSSFSFDSFLFVCFYEGMRKCTKCIYLFLWWKRKTFVKCSVLILNICTVCLSADALFFPVICLFDDWLAWTLGRSSNHFSINGMHRAPSWIVFWVVSQSRNFVFMYRVFDNSVHKFSFKDKFKVQHTFKLN